MSERRQVVTAGAPASRRGGPWGLWELPALEENGVAALLGLARAFCESGPFDLDSRCEPGLWLRYAHGHGLMGLLGGLALAGKVEDGILATEGREHYFTNLLRHEQALRVCDRLRDAAQQAGVRLSLIKGPSLASEVYGDGGVRGYTDIDLLMASEREARAFAECLEGRPWPEGPGPSLGRWIKQPGRVTAHAAGWEIEIAFPWGRPSGPLGELQLRDADRIRPAAHDSPLARPEPSVYLVLLIEHLARHLGERLIWYVDLVRFVRHFEHQLDWTWIQTRIDELGMGGVSGLITRLCHEHLDPAFPPALLDRAGRADRLCSMIFEPANVVRGFRATLRRRGPWSRFVAVNVQRVIRYWLLADGPVRRSHAARWSAALLINAAGVRGWLLPRFVEAGVAILGHYGSLLAVWSVGARVEGRR